MRNEEVKNAKAVLKENGYNVDCLWHYEDVQTEFDCTQEEAEQVLRDVFMDDHSFEDIYGLITIYGNRHNLKRTHESI